MGFGIHECSVEYAGPRSKKIRRIAAVFGDGHRLELVAGDGATTLRVITKRQTIALRADGPVCDVERAVNLLRTHMPQA